MTEKRAEDNLRNQKDPETAQGMEKIKKKYLRTKGASSLKMVTE